MRARQTYQEITAGYETPDPWGYKNNPADIARKKIIIDTLNRYGPFGRALDIGCGEGWITQDIPANEIHGWDLSAKAMGRFPKNVQAPMVPNGLYDLVVLTGALYDHYNCEELVDLVNTHAAKLILLCNIKEWESKHVERVKGRQIFSTEFKYERSETEKYTQKLRVIRV